MKTNFEYWINAEGKTFLLFYWIAFVSIYCLSILLTLKTKNPFAFGLGFSSFFMIQFYLILRKPFGTLEEGIKKYNYTLYENLAKKIPTKYSKNGKKRAACLLYYLSEESEETLGQNIFAFKNNYWRITNAGTLSLSLLFLTWVVLTICLFVA